MRVVTSSLLRRSVSSLDGRGTWLSWPTLTKAEVAGVALLQELPAAASPQATETGGFQDRCSWSAQWSRMRVISDARFAELRYPSDSSETCLPYLTELLKRGQTSDGDKFQHQPLLALSTAYCEERAGPGQKSSHHGKACIGGAALPFCVWKTGLSSPPSAAVPHTGSLRRCQPAPHHAAPPQLWSPPLRLLSWRGFSSKVGGTGPEEPFEFTNRMLQTAAVVDFRHRLQNLSSQSPIMNWSEVLALCVESGAALSEQGAREVLAALQASGNIIIAGKWVYLRPEEVIDTVIRHMPHTTDDLQERIQELESRIAPLKEEKDDIQRKGEARGRWSLYAVLFAMTVQFLTIFRLTYWELSWDVMEPAAYFAGAGTSILCLLYYIVFQTPFDYGQVDEQWKNRYLAARSFPHAEYEALQREKERYMSMLEKLRIHKVGARGPLIK